MFDELKQVKYFKQTTDFMSLITWKYFKQIKRLKSLQEAEANLEL